MKNKINKIKLSTIAILLLSNSLIADEITVSNLVQTPILMNQGDSLNITTTGNVTNEVTNSFGITSIGSITVDGKITNTNDDALRFYDVDILGNITVNGTITSSDRGSRALIFNNGSNSISLDGSIINTGRLISITGDSSNSDGLAIFGENDVSNSLVITGKINNEGTIIGGSEGIDIDNRTTISGGIINSGYIEGLSGEGIEIDEQATISGGILNSGTIIAGNSAIEIDNDDDNDDYRVDIATTISGDIVNTSTAKLLGNNGLYIRNQEFSDNNLETTINGNIINAGLIKANNNALIIEDSSIINGNIINSGTIFGGDYSITSDAGSIINGSITNTSSGNLLGLVNINSAVDSFINNGNIFLKSGIDFNSFENTGIAGENNINGNYVQSQSGLLDFAIDSNTTSGTTYSSLTVTGDVQLPNLAKISLDVKNNGNNLANSMVFENIITSNSTLTTSTFDVIDNSLAYSFIANNDGSGGVDLIVNSTGLTTIENAVSTKIKDVGRALDNLNDGTVSTAFGGFTTETEVQEAVEQTLPTLAGDSSKATFNSMQSVNNIVQARIEGTTGISSGDEIVEGHAWAKPFGSWAKQKDNNGNTGFSSDTYGMVIGSDKEINSTDRLGLAIAYANSKTKSNSELQESNIDIYQGIVYGSKKLSDKLEVNFQSDISLNKTNGARTINFGGLNRTAISNYNSVGFHIGTGIKKVINIDSTLNFSANTRLDYTYIKDNNYKEEGAGALNLIVERNTNSKLIASSGIKAVKEINDNLKLTGTLGIAYDFNAREGSVTSAYEGASSASFVTKGIDTNPWILKAGLGTVINDYKGVEFTTNYDVEAKEDYSNQTVSLKARWAF